METKEKSAEDLAFAFCKEPVLEVLKSVDKTKNLFENFGITESLISIWYEELTGNLELLDNDSKTKNIEILLDSSYSMTEFCCKIVLLYSLREKALLLWGNVEYQFMNEIMKFFKKL